MMRRRVRVRLPFEWRQGEHLAIVGDTGSGKSTLAAFLLDHWQYYVVVQVKDDDVRYSGHTVRRALDLDDIRYDRFVLKPAYDEQGIEIRRALESTWRASGWTIYLDELFYLEDQLRIKRPITRLLTQGRSKGLTAVIGMQRPVLVTRFGISQSKHVLAFFQEGRDAKTLGQATSARVEREIATLERYEFLWFYRPTRAIWRGRLQDIGGTV